MALRFPTTACELLATYNLHDVARYKLYSLIQQKNAGMRVTKRDVHNIDSWLFEFPCTFVMRDFEQHKTDRDEWLSEPFYTSAQGYKMRLGVYAMGYGEGRGRCISVAVHLMPGQFDDYLTWPFRGTVNIELLDHSPYQQHIKKPVSSTFFTPEDKSGRPVGAMNAGVCIPDFATYGYSQNEFVKDDCLFFRVSDVTVYST